MGVQLPQYIGEPSSLLLILAGIFFLYAEIHYRLAGGPSRLYRRHPEVLADTPFRLGPGMSLPIFLLIKDAHRYPISLEVVEISVKKADVLIFHNRYSINEDIEEFWWHKLIHCRLPDSVYGELKVRVQFTYTRRGKRYIVINDNYPTLSHADYSVYRSSNYLPEHQKFAYGDLHYHSNFTSDQIEYGAPIDVSALIAKSAGLDFLAISDHSYDLDTHLENYKKLDSTLAKWYLSREEISAVNQNIGSHKALLLPAEEVTVRNSNTGNVHMLVINHPAFIPGTGDSGRKIRGQSEHSVGEVLDMLTGQSLAIAGHPHSTVPLLQRWLIRRDSWKTADIQLSKLSGLQILNGIVGQDFLSGKSEWIRHLLDGDRKFIYAGNDAHGNFNRYRQIDLPMATMKEHNDQILGKCRTGLLINQNDSQKVDAVCSALRQGKCFITNGPSLILEVQGNQRKWQMGDVVPDGNYALKMNAKSTKEFGHVDSLTLFRGIIGEQREYQVFTKSYQNHSEISMTYEHNSINQTCYYRAEITTKKDKTFALTNPVWIQVSAKL